jgi:excisionase family DNA binding protein
MDLSEISEWSWSVPLPTHSDELAILLSHRLEAALAVTSDATERSKLVLQVVQLSERLAIEPLRAHVLSLLRDGRDGSLGELLEHVEGRYQAFRGALKGKRKRRTPEQAAYMSPGEVAAYLGVSPKTIAMWCDRGKLPCIVLSSGHRRIPADAIAPYKAMLSELKTLDESVAPAWADVSEDDVLQEMFKRGRLGP